jgi:hypothetical protein
MSLSPDPFFTNKSVPTIAIDDCENTEKSLIQRLARTAARQPKKALLVSFGITTFPPLDPSSPVDLN